ncbi:MAG: hypothetical protein RL181_1806 [Bacteroidota bacterium]
MGASSLGLALLGSFHPRLVEVLYSRGLFMGLRRMADAVLAFLPFPACYILLAVLVGWGMVRIRDFVVKRGIRPATAEQQIAPLRGIVVGSRAVFRAFRPLLNGLGWLLFFFFWMWGFNYYRLPVEQQLGLAPVPLDGAALKSAFEEESRALAEARRQLPGSKGRAFAESDLPPGLEDTVRDALTSVLRRSGYPTAGKVRVRLLQPSGVLLRFSTAGVYLPFSAEGHVDKGLHPVQWPFTLAHEMAHGYGFGNEGVCNFWAALACLQSKDPGIRYAGRLAYWRYVAVEYRRYDSEGFRKARAALPREIVLDLEAIQKAMDRYPDLVPRLQYQLYDSYLKSQGIKEGMKSYSQVLLLVRSWEKKHRKL